MLRKNMFLLSYTPSITSSQHQPGSTFSLRKTENTARYKFSLADFCTALGTREEVLKLK